MNVAVILAGGSGTRVGAERPKQFVEVLGKPVIAYTLEIFERNSHVDAVEVGCHEQWRDYLLEIIEKFGIKKVKWIVNGGDTFQETVLNCVNHMKGKISADDYVMLHYAAAPFTKQSIIDDNIRVAHEKGMSFAATPIYQLLGTNDEDSISNEWKDRDKFIQVACPQTFRYSYLLQIYKEAEKQGYLETVEPHTTSLMYALGLPLYKSYSDQTNIKITTKEDIALFEGWVRMNAARAENGETWL